MIKNLAEVIESWIREVVAEVTVDVKLLEDKLKEMESLHERDANRIANLEREILLLKGNPVQLESNDDQPLAHIPTDEVIGALENSISELADRVDEFSVETEDLRNEISDHEYRIDTLESDTIEKDDALILIRDEIEVRMPKMVKDELDITDFRVSIVR